MTSRLGMLTPSSNSVLEPLTAAMLANIPDITAHFGRFRVLKISLESDALQQFTNEPMLDASSLLADAKVDTICWNGTSSGWLGFDNDHELCKQIESHTGIKACTSVLALNEAFDLVDAKRIAFVTPYLDDIQEAIIKNYNVSGYEVVAEQHLGDPGNYSFCTYSEEKILDMCRTVAAHKPDAISVFCTNFRGPRVAETIEKETGIPVFDSISTALWKSMKLAGEDASQVKGWGSLFTL